MLFTIGSKEIMMYKLSVYPRRHEKDIGDQDQVNTD